MSELKDGCVRPAKGPIVEEVKTEEKSYERRWAPMRVKVGKEAIDFEATAYVRGEGFKIVKLSDYRGKWIVLCFYPGDFTFV